MIERDTVYDLVDHISWNTLGIRDSHFELYAICKEQSSRFMDALIEVARCAVTQVRQQSAEVGHVPESFRYVSRRQGATKAMVMLDSP